jgi:hypothetical protein
MRLKIQQGNASFTELTSLDFLPVYTIMPLYYQTAIPTQTYVGVVDKDVLLVLILF